MSTPQLEACADRLREVSAEDAAAFLLMQEQANEDLRAAFKRVHDMRRRAWSIYHQHFPRRK